MSSQIGVVPVLFIGRAMLSTACRSFPEVEGTQDGIVLEVVVMVVAVMIVPFIAILSAR
jgi:hypothetical protein